MCTVNICLRTSACFRIPSYGEIVDEHFSEEETEIEKAEEFEHKYNFRFEEPDPDFIKRYPRTLDDSLRRKDDSRKKKRDEVSDIYHVVLPVIRSIVFSYCCCRNQTSQAHGFTSPSEQFWHFFRGMNCKSCRPGSRCSAMNCKRTHHYDTAAGV